LQALHGGSVGRPELSRPSPDSHRRLGEVAGAAARRPTSRTEVATMQSHQARNGKKKSPNSCTMPTRIPPARGTRRGSTSRCDQAGWLRLRSRRGGWLLSYSHWRTPPTPATARSSSPSARYSRAYWPAQSFSRKTISVHE
jgi:hypothetical protein